MAYSHVTLNMSACEGFGDLADSWRYHHLRTVYASLRSEFPIAGSNHAPISSVAFSTRRLESTMRDLRADLVSVRATFQLCH